MASCNGRAAIHAALGRASIRPVRTQPQANTLFTVSHRFKIASFLTSFSVIVAFIRIYETVLVRLCCSITCNAPPSRRSARRPLQDLEAPTSRLRCGRFYPLPPPGKSCFPASSPSGRQFRQATCRISPSRRPPAQYRLRSLTLCGP